MSPQGKPKSSSPASIWKQGLFPATLADTISLTLRARGTSSDRLNLKGTLRPVPLRFSASMDAAGSAPRMARSAPARLHKPLPVRQALREPRRHDHRGKGERPRHTGFGFPYRARPPAQGRPYRESVCRAPPPFRGHVPLFFGFLKLRGQGNAAGPPAHGRGPQCRQDAGHPGVRPGKNRRGKSPPPPSVFPWRP